MNTTTKLDAVNTLLMSIGEDPVNALGLGIEDQTAAEAIVDEVTRKVQVLGWSWNTEDNYTFMRQVDNTVTVASNVLSIDFHNKQYVLRGTKVYDKVNHAYTLSGDVKGTVIFGLDWDLLPEAARQYIMYSSGRIFQARQVGSQILNQFTEKDEQAAWLALRSNEESVSNHSIFDNYELQLWLNRDAAAPVFDYPAGSIIGGA